MDTAKRKRRLITGNAPSPVDRLGLHIPPTFIWSKTQQTLMPRVHHVTVVSQVFREILNVALYPTALMGNSNQVR